MGEKIRVRPLVAKMLSDSRIVDAVLTISEKDKTPGESGADFDTLVGTTVDLAEVSFATDTFSAAPPVGQKIAVEVRDSFTFQLLAVEMEVAKVALKTKLSGFFGSLIQAPASTARPSSPLCATIPNTASTRSGIYCHSDSGYTVRADRAGRPQLYRQARSHLHSYFGGGGGVSRLSRMLDLLPPPYTNAPDSVLSQWLNLAALEMDAFQEDLDLYQRSHFIETVFRLREAEKIGALMGIRRLDWKDLGTYREAVAGADSGTAPGRHRPARDSGVCIHVPDSVERVLDSTYVPGLRFASTAEAAYQPLRDSPKFRPLRLLENPVRKRTSNTLRAANGRVPYLFRWEEENRGLDDAVPTLHISGVLGGTSVPILVNLTTGELVGYKARLRFGQILSIEQKDKDGTEPTASASLDGHDVTSALFSMHGFELGSRLHPTSWTRNHAYPNWCAAGTNGFSSRSATMTSRG